MGSAVALGQVSRAEEQAARKVIVKSIKHFRIRNERDVLRRFQDQAPFIRPLLDEVTNKDSSLPPTIILKYLDDDILAASDARRFTRREVKYVATGVLEALAILHDEGFVHTDIKPSNFLANYNGENQNRFKDIQLADFGSTMHIDSGHARDGDLIGTPIFRSPEPHLQLPWGTETDSWSFGATLITLYGHGFHIFKPSPEYPFDHPDHPVQITLKHYRIFGPFPKWSADIAGIDQARLWTYRPFCRATEREIKREDRETVCEVMRIHPGERSTASELLGDEWLGRGMDD
ncbi:kinase-like protein [Aspergillus undulatus]|uniref:kinase-like protein n=1 Tax=Aspergillus undulatus TaxID=1810928 RepID=UPI003CCE3C68